MPNPPDATTPRPVSLASAISHYRDKLGTETVGGTFPRHNPKAMSRVTRFLKGHLLAVLPGDSPMSQLTQSDYQLVLDRLRNLGFDDHTGQQVFHLLASLNRHACKHGFIETDCATPILENLYAASNGVRATPTRKRLGGPSAFQKMIRDSVVFAGVSNRDL